MEGRIGVLKIIIALLESNNPKDTMDGLASYSRVFKDRGYKVKDTENCTTEEEELVNAAFLRLIAVIKQNQDENAKMEAIHVLKKTKTSSQAVLESEIVPDLIEALGMRNEYTNGLSSKILKLISSSKGFPWESTIGTILDLLNEDIFCNRNWKLAGLGLTELLTNYILYAKELNEDYFQQILYLIHAVSNPFKFVAGGGELNEIQDEFAISCFCDKCTEIQRKFVMNSKMTQDSLPMIHHLIATRDNFFKSQQIIRFLLEINDEELISIWRSLPEHARKKLFSNDFLSDDSFKLQKKSLKLMRKLTFEEKIEEFLLIPLSALIQADKTTMMVTEREIFKNEDDESNRKIEGNFELRNEIIETFQHLFAVSQIEKAAFLESPPPFLHLLSLKDEIPDVHLKTISYLENILKANEDIFPNKKTSKMQKIIKFFMEKKEHKNYKSTKKIVDFFKNLFSNNESLEREALHDTFEIGRMLGKSEPFGRFFSECFEKTIIPRFLAISGAMAKPIEFCLEILEELNDLLITRDFLGAASPKFFRRIIDNVQQILENSSQNQHHLEKCFKILEMIAFAKEYRFFQAKLFEVWRNVIEGFFQQEITKLPFSDSELFQRIARILFQIACCDRLDVLNEIKKNMRNKWKGSDYHAFETRESLIPLFIQFLLNSRDIEILRPSVVAIEALLEYLHPRDLHSYRFLELFTKRVRVRYEELSNCEDSEIQGIAKRRLSLWSVFEDRTR